MIMDKITKELQYINTKIADTTCKFCVITCKKDNIYKIEILDIKNKTTLQSYDFASKKHILEFLESYQIIDNYIQFINNNFKKTGV